MDIDEVNRHPHPPITAVATMSLVDEGVLRLDQPVDDLLPELADRRVLRAIDAELDDTMPADQLHRLATEYTPVPETGELSVLDDPADSWWSTPPSFPDASGWLVSTIGDYWSFVSMLLAGGNLRGRRIV